MTELTRVDYYTRKFIQLLRNFVNCENKTFDLVDEIASCGDLMLSSRILENAHCYLGQTFLNDIIIGVNCMFAPTITAKRTDSGLQLTFDWKLDTELGRLVSSIRYLQNNRNSETQDLFLLDVDSDYIETRNAARRVNNCSILSAADLLGSIIRE